MKYCVLYNPKSGVNPEGKNPAETLTEIMQSDELDFCSMPEISDFKKFFKLHRDPVIICGGDGTLNYFLNKIRDLKIKNILWYFPTGSGNDFATDAHEDGRRPFLLTGYLKHLPTLTVNGKSYVVINGAGAGVDGYVCHENNQLKKSGRMNITYTLVGVKAMLYAYKPLTMHIEVDGEKYDFENVWFAPAMIGKYFGGGMMVAPMQKRLSSEKLAVIVATHPSRLRILTLFPKLFSGEHIKNRQIVKVLFGNHIKVKFDQPTILQYDGETITDVSEYEINF